MMNIIRNMMAVAVALVATASASAQEAKDITPIELEKNYRLPQGRSYWSYEASETTRLILKSNKSDVPYPYTDSTYTDYAAAGTYYANYDGSGRIVLYMNVEKGKKYWLGANVLNSGVTFRATTKENTSIDTTYVSNAQGEVLDITGGSVTSVSFDNRLAKGDVRAVIASGAKSASLSISGGNYSVSFDLRATVCSWLKSGEVKPGDPITITITNIHLDGDENVKFGKDGTLVLNYLAPSVPIALVRKTVPSALKSYWPAGDEEGRIVLEFDGDLFSDYVTAADSARRASATLGCGQREYDGQYYNEQLPIEISGKSLIVRLDGKARSLAEYLAYTEESPYVNIKVSNIRDAEGNLCFVEEQGHVASYSFSFTFEDVATDLAYEFTPADSTNIRGTSDIQIWLSTDKAFSFTGVRFDYVKGGEAKSIVLSKEQLEIAALDGGIEVSVPVPADVKEGATEISVTFDGVETIDGIDRTIVAHYTSTDLSALQTLRNASANEAKAFTLDGKLARSGKLAKGVYIIGKKKVAVK